MARGLLLPPAALPFLGRDELGLLNSNTSSRQWVSTEGGRYETRTRNPIPIPCSLPTPLLPLLRKSTQTPPHPPGKPRVHCEQQPRVNKYTAEMLVTCCGPHHRPGNCMAPDWVVGWGRVAGSSKDLCSQSDLFIKQTGSRLASPPH